MSAIREDCDRSGKRSDQLDPQLDSQLFDGVPLDAQGTSAPDPTASLTL